LIHFENDNDSDNIRSRLNFSDDDLLYDKNSINILYESIELLEELRTQFKKHNPRNIERRNGMLIFDLVTKYCQYAETLGAIINGFEVSNKSKNPSSSVVLSYLKNYEIHEVKNFFKEISSPNYMNLTEMHKQKLIYAFGYYKSNRNNVDEIIEQIFKLLKEIAGVYSVFVESYNASKHGHRVWYGYDLTTQRSNSLLYIEKKNNDNNYSMNKVSLDDGVISDYIMPYSKDCQKLFEMILENNNKLRTKGQT
jgi:hypothetical protein